jgi:hypothetical protein
MKTSLQPGNYMRTKAVINWLDTNLPAHKYAEQIMDECPIYQGSESNYFLTEDLKSIIKPELFREMECDCTTYVIRD